MNKQAEMQSYRGFCGGASNLSSPQGFWGKCKVKTLKRQGFTLAEVLITLVIIGIVAAMTIPSLMVKLDKVVKENQIKVFTSKLQQGMDRMNLAGEIGPYYSTTEDFIKALSAHMKIVTICKSGELDNCFPYENLQVKDVEEPIKVKDLKPANLGLSEEEGYKDVAGMVLADGTPMLLSWKTDCPVSDPDSSTRKASIVGGEEPVLATSCIKGIYDTNGTKGPNLFLKDVLGFNATLQPVTGGGYTEIAGLKISKVLAAGSWQPMTKQEICGETATASSICTATGEAAALGIKEGHHALDYWAGAVRECGGVDKMPTMQQLADLAMALYKKTSGGSTPTIGEYQTADSLTYQTNSEAATSLAALGLTPEFALWSGKELSGMTYACSRHFTTADTTYYMTGRGATDYSAVCLGD